MTSMLRSPSLLLSAFVLAASVTGLSPAALAADEPGAEAADDRPPPTPPSAEELKRVTDYFLRGKEQGPVVMDFVACAKTGKSTEGKLVCEEAIDGTLEKGAPLIAYSRFFVPKGGKYDDLKVKFLLDGEVRSTSDFTLRESWSGYANYKQTTASKPGVWELRLLRGDQVLKSVKVTVK